MARRNDDAIIRRMARRIVDEFRPERIILFGSRARGEGTADSDVDLLVVLQEVRSKREAQLRIRLALGEYGLPKDVIVTTLEEFAWRKDTPGTIEHPAALEGKVLYART